MESNKDTKLNKEVLDELTGSTLSSFKASKTKKIKGEVLITGTIGEDIKNVNKEIFYNPKNNIVTWNPEKEVFEKGLVIPQDILDTQKIQDEKIWYSKKDILEQINQEKIGMKEPTKNNRRVILESNDNKKRYPAKLLLHMEDEDFLYYINNDNYYFEGSKLIIDRVQERIEEIENKNKNTKKIVNKISNMKEVEELIENIDLNKLSRKQLRKMNKNKFSNQVKNKLLNNK